jgi:hypothetical protein
VRYSPRAALLFAALMASAGADSLGAQNALHRGFRTNPDVAFRVMVPAGRVRVVVWDRDSIDVTGMLGKNSTFFGGGAGAGAKMGVEARMQKDSVLADADLTITVPKRARVWVKMTMGTIDAVGSAGELELYTVGGSIAVAGASGVISAESIDAGVTISHSSGATRVRTGKGNVRLLDVTGTVSVATVSGPVDIRGSVAPEARVETIGGSITLNVARFGGMLVDLQTHSGDITIAAVSSSMPQLDLLSRGGSVTKPIPVGSEKEGRVVARSFKGAINVKPVSGIQKGK